MELLRDTISRIEKKGLDPDAMKKAGERWNSIAHPLHSLGRFEEIIIRTAGIQGTPDITFGKKALIVMCADNGIVAEGVTQTGQEVTAAVSENFLRGKTAAAIMCRECGADIFPVDIGINGDTSLPGDRKIAPGTGDFLKESAMTRDQAVRSVETGISVIREKYDQGYRLFAAGEMGIGNTASSSAVASVFLDADPAAVTGRGAGLASEGLSHKISVIRESIAGRRPDRRDPVDVLSKVGGFDIGGMAGLFLGGAACGCPVIADGFISCTAMLLAAELCPSVKPFLIASHVSGEPGGRRILSYLGLNPVLHADMSLGEGTGAVMMFPLLDMSLAVYRDMPTFDDEKIKAYEELV